jgi:hypothetical protein
MKPLFIVTLFFILLAACDNTAISGSTGKQAAASSSSSAATEVSLSGENGMAALGGDALVIKEGKLFINGTVVHDIPTGAVVRYSIANQVKALYINDVLIPLNK